MSESAAKRRRPQREPGPDWLRVGHRVFALLRTLRGDGAAIETDHRVERERGATMNQTMEQIARRAVGCRQPEPCNCAMCEEGKEG